MAKIKKIIKRIKPKEIKEEEVEKPVEEIKSEPEVKKVKEEVIEVPVVAEDSQAGLKMYIKCLQSLKSEMEKQGIRDLSQLDAILAQKLAELK